MTSVSSSTSQTRPFSIPPGLLPKVPSIDPAASIPQNPATRPAAMAAPGRFASAETYSLTDCLSLTVWCPEAYHHRLDTILHPFGARIAVERASAETAAEVDLSDNQPRLLVVPQLTDALATALADQRSDPETDARPATLPPALSEMVAQWCNQAEAVIDAVREARGHITLLAAEAVLGPMGPVRQALSVRYSLPLETQPDDQDPGEILATGHPPAVALMADAIAQSDAQVKALLERLEAVVLKVDGVDLCAERDPAAQQSLLLAADTMGRAERDALARAHAQDLHRVEVLAEANIQRLRHVADEARLQVLQRETEARRLSEEAQQTTAATDYLKEELTRRETTYSAQSTEVAMMRYEAEQLEVARKSVSLKGNRLDREVAVLARNIAMRDERIQGLAQAVVGYEDEALALRAEVDALRRSTSWRLTAPVRGLSIIVRKMLGRG